MPIDEAGHGIIGDAVGDLLRRLRAAGAEPVRGPVECAEKSARGDGGVRGPQRTPPDSAEDQRADAALVAIALGDDARAERQGQGVDFEVRRRPFHVVEQAQDVRGGEVAQPAGERRATAPRPRERREHPVERLVLAEEQQFVLAAEVVIEIARRQIGGRRDVAHAGGGEAARAEHLRGGTHDGDTARIGAL